jgi:hypothetical protein
MKWKPERAARDSDTAVLYIGAASMHAGSGVHKIDLASSLSKDHYDSSSKGDELSIMTVASQVDSNEQRLVYGIDWLKKNDTKEVEKEANSFEEISNYDIVTCSFYDNLVQIWSL